MILNPVFGFSMIMRTIIISVLWLLIPTITLAADESVILQSTTSTQNSGLYDYLLPRLKGILVLRSML